MLSFFLSPHHHLWSLDETYSNQWPLANLAPRRERKQEFSCLKGQYWRVNLLIHCEVKNDYNCSISSRYWAVTTIKYFWCVIYILWLFQLSITKQSRCTFAACSRYIYNIVFFSSNFIQNLLFVDVDVPAVARYNLIQSLLPVCHIKHSV